MAAVLRLPRALTFLKHSRHLAPSYSAIFLRHSHRLRHAAADMVRLRKNLQHGPKNPYASKWRPYAAVVPTSRSATSRTEPQPTCSYLPSLGLTHIILPPQLQTWLPSLQNNERPGGVSTTLLTTSQLPRGLGGRGESIYL